MKTDLALKDERSILQIVHIDETGDSYYRMRWPGKQLSEMAPNWRVISLDGEARERFEWAEAADLLILFQCHDQEMLSIIQRRRAQGKKTLVEYNDNFYNPPVTSTAYEAWINPLIWQTYERIMNAADGVIVTGPGLAELFSRKTKKPIFQIKNQLPDASLSEFKNLWPNQNEQIVFGWGGSQGHLPDLLAFAPLIRELIREFPNLKLKLMGNETIPTYLDIPSSRFEFVPWGSMSDYLRFLGSLHLGFAPLLNTPYNLCRSDIKAVEMAGRGVLPILPRLLPYQEFLQRAKLDAYSTPSDFLEMIRAYLKNPDRMRSDAERAYGYVKSQRLSFQNRERLELCLQMMPKSGTTMKSDLPMGYHEIHGTSMPQPLYRTALIEAEALFNSKKREESIHILEKEIERNPEVPDLALGYLKALRAMGSSQFLDKLSEFRSLFLGDLRFLLFEIQIELAPDKILLLWAELWKQLSASSFYFRTYFRNQILQLLTNGLQKNKSLLDIGHLFLELYPTSLALRFQIARALEFQGKNKEALEEFKFLLEGFKDCRTDQNFLAKLNKTELQMFDHFL